MWCYCFHIFTNTTIWCFVGSAGIKCDYKSWFVGCKHTSQIVLEGSFEETAALCSANSSSKCIRADYEIVYLVNAICFLLKEHVLNRYLYRLLLYSSSDCLQMSEGILCRSSYCAMGWWLHFHLLKILLYGLHHYQ